LPCSFTPVGKSREEVERHLAGHYCRVRVQVQHGRDQEAVVRLGVRHLQASALWGGGGGCFIVCVCGGGGCYIVWVGGCVQRGRGVLHVGRFALDKIGNAYQEKNPARDREPTRQPRLPANV
jgi:hypothetical protein